MMRGSRAGASQQLRRADKPIIGRQLSGKSPGEVSRKPISRRSIVSTCQDSLTSSAMGTASASLTSAPKTPQCDQTPPGSERGKSVTIITAPSKDDASSDTDSVDLGKSDGEAESELWSPEGEENVDSVVAKLQNLISMTQAQLEITGRRVSLVGGGARGASIETRRTDSRRTSQIAMSKRLSQTQSPVASCQLGETRSSIDSSGTLMFDMLDLVTADLALLTEDLACLASDPDNRICELEEKLEKLETTGHAAQEEILRLRAENEKLKLEREAALTAFESACAQSGLASSIISSNTSTKVSCEPIEEDEVSVPQAEKANNLPSRTTEPAEVAKAVDEIAKPTVYQMIQSKQKSHASEISLGKTALRRSLTLANGIGFSSAVPTGTALSASPPAVAREVVAPKATVLSVASGASAGSLGGKYMQTLRQNGSTRSASPLPSYAPSNRTHLASQCSRPQSPPRVVEVSTSCSRSGSPLRSASGPPLSLLPFSGRPPTDSRHLSHLDSAIIVCSSEATSSYQPATRTPATVALPIGGTRSFTPHEINRQLSPLLPAEHREANLSGSVALPIGGTRSVSPHEIKRQSSTLRPAEQQEASLSGSVAPPIGGTRSVSPHEIKRQSSILRPAEQQEASLSSTVVGRSTRPLRWKLKWVLE